MGWRPWTSGVPFIESDASVRFVQTYRRAGRPLPAFSEDSYIDFCVAEAVILKDMSMERKAAKAQRENEVMTRWKRDEITSDEAERLRAQL